MLRTTGIFCSFLATILSIAVLAVAGWLWHRSMTIGDLVVRMEPAPENQSRMRGVGSYRGAVLIGYVIQPQAIDRPTEFRHDVIPAFSSGSSGGSMLQAVPSSTKKALGFGVTDGQLRVTLPPPLLAFMAPPARTFHVVYVPYYFLMLLALVQPLLLARRYTRRERSVERIDLSTVPT